VSDKADRAKQFMPFAALKGYYDLVREKEKIVSDRRELSEYRAELLSNKLLKVRRGMVIRVVYYHDDGYIKTEGMVSGIDLTLRILTVIKTKIPFGEEVKK